MKTVQKMYIYKEVKNSVRYSPSSGEEKPISQTIYISKELLPKPFPKEVTITLEVEG